MASNSERPEGFVTYPALGETLPGGVALTKEVIPELHDEEPSGVREHALLSWVEGEYLTSGQVPSIEHAAGKGLDYEWYAKWITSRPFRKQLFDRGIPINTGYEEDQKLAPKALTEEQYAAISVVSDLNDNRSYKRKLSELGINTQKWQAWLHDPEFVKALNTKAEAEFVTHKFDALYALLDEVRSGNLNAIKYYNEMTGRFVSAKDRVNSIDPIALVQQMVEVLQEETKNLEGGSEVVQKVGERLMGTIASAAAQNGINEGG